LPSPGDEGNDRVSTTATAVRWPSCLPTTPDLVIVVVRPTAAGTP